MNPHPYRGTGVTIRALDMVTKTEMESLCDALHRGQIPADLQAKLERLRADDPKEFYLKHQSLLLASLLMSSAAQSYCTVRPDVCERLLRMLAYVRKDDDAIPDTWAGGMADDHDLMRLTCMGLRGALDTFKAWHLSRRVPLLWNAQTNSTDRRCPLTAMAAARAAVFSAELSSEWAHGNHRVES